MSELREFTGISREPLPEPTVTLTVTRAELDTLILVMEMGARVRQDGDSQCRGLVDKLRILR